MPPTRAPLEFNIYRVVAAATHVLPQNAKKGDGDLHLVLEAGGKTIAEAPRASCNRSATPGATTARPGSPRNEIELHPILKFRCLD